MTDSVTSSDIVVSSPSAEASDVSAVVSQASPTPSLGDHSPHASVGSDVNELANSNTASSVSTLETVNSTTSSRAFNSLIDSLYLAGERLDETWQEIKLMRTETDVEEEMSSLLEFCDRTVQGAESVYNKIISNPLIKQNSKERAERKWCKLRMTMDQIKVRNQPAGNNNIPASGASSSSVSYVSAPSERPIVSTLIPSSSSVSASLSTRGAALQLSPRASFTNAVDQPRVHSRVSATHYNHVAFSASPYERNQTFNNLPSPDLELGAPSNPALPSRGAQYYPPGFDNLGTPRVPFNPPAPGYQRQVGYGVTPPVTLEKFSGNVMEYPEFRRKFAKFVANVYLDDDVRMMHLQSLCIGEAGRAIRGLGGHANRTLAYQTAWERLDQRFGNHNLLVSQLREEMLKGPPIKEFDSSALNCLRDRMFECEQTYLSLGRSAELNSSEVIQSIFDRLPERLKRRFVPLFRIGRGSFTELRVLVDDAAADAECPLGQSMFKSKVKLSTEVRQPRSRSSHVRVNAVRETPVSANRNRCCEMCEGEHRIWSCPRFKEMSVEKRNDFIKSHRLCFNCLQPGHVVHECSFRLNCRQCGKRHNSLLHRDGAKQQPLTSQKSSNSDVLVACNSCQDSKLDRGKKLHKVVPVKVWLSDPERFVYTWAYMDDGSETSLCTTAFAKRLGADLVSAKVQMHTNNAVTTVTSQVKNIHIQGLEEDRVFQVKGTLVQDSIVDVQASIPKTEVACLFPHLRDLSFPKLEPNKVELLLGQNVQNAFRVSEFRYGTDDQPFGLHTALGWTLWGVDHVSQNELGDHRVCINFVRELGFDESGCDEVLKILDQDFHDLDMPQIPCMSRDDRRATAIMEKSLSKVERHHQVALPWKTDPPGLPNNRHVAEKRLRGLRKKLLDNPELRKQYNEKMSELVANGFCSPIPEGAPDPEGRTWYVPHHCTSPLTKFRVVFDCSAKAHGVSLNDKLLQGPDLTNSLVGVLIRFRQEPIAVVADIKAMFYQVLVDEKDRDVFRFLWYPNNDLNCTPVPFRMNVHLFGATSSPSVAAFALRRTALENVTEADPETVSTVFNNFYVDDLCKSCATPEQATKLIRELCELLDSGGFRLTKFLSNDKQVLSLIPEENRASTVVDLQQRQLPTQKALGVYWNAETDCLEVKVNLSAKPCTRRGLLSMIAQTYDPLGLLQPFILPARKILQEVCRLGLSWDEPLPSTVGGGKSWEQWVQALPHLEAISLARSYKLPNHEIESIELHVFSDASTDGYGACAYLRFLYVDDLITCVLIMGKARVAPLKPISIPRLELTAAVLAAKLGAMISRELEYELSKVIFWTDATVVLHYLQNVSTRFQTFVANRLELLHSLTSVDQWRYVPTDQNPADIASRGLSPSKASEADLWFHGPTFLHHHETQWPKQPNLCTELKKEDPEVKKNVCSVKLAEPECTGLYLLLRRYSDFPKLQRSVAWLLRYRHYLRCKVDPNNKKPFSGLLTTNDMSEAVLAIAKATQTEAFPQAMKVLHNHENFHSPMQLASESLLKRPFLRPLQSLNPYLVNGLLRVGGRLQNAPVDDCMKYPIILPHDHPVTRLLIMFYHVREGHMGTSHTLTAMNKMYWIVNGRSAVKKTLRSCLNCKFWKAKVGEQQMGNLPAHRVTPSAPFSACGTDLMGPLYVRIGRSNVKRYVCIFNCLATRAVHFEIVQSMEATSFIQAFRRFCNRRITTVRHIYSDNGGNFVLANRELKDGIKLWRSKNFQDAMLQQEITWHFGPPLASHQNGFTEAFFRIVRKIFRSVVGEATLEEYDLLTLMTEIERILNDRPITALSSTPEDMFALTPSMILTGSIADNVSPGVFLKSDSYRRSWKKTQYLADLFWQRWIGEYLPLLQPRQKWFGTSPTLKPGDLVLVMDEAVKRGRWPKGIIETVIPDSNNLVRRVKVRTAHSTLVRDIRKVCLLEGYDEQ